MKEYYAHSGDFRYNVPPQLYSTHVNNVVELTRSNLDTLLNNSTLTISEKLFLSEVTLLAAYYHDIGKLDEAAQIYLKESSYSDEKMLNHVDAGVSLLLSKYNKTKKIQYVIAAYFVYCHHIGLQDFEDLFEEKKIFFGSEFNPLQKIRDTRKIEGLYNIITDKYNVKEYVDSNIQAYESIHTTLVTCPVELTYNKSNIPCDSFSLKMAFSCLIDADHTDSANHSYKNVNKFEDCVLYPDKRLSLLDVYIKNKTNDSSSKRNENRRLLYSECDIGTKQCDGNNYYLVDAPVGLGKTFSCLRLSLSLAKKHNLKRISVILPFTNIIQQVVNDYRESILLENEDPHIINEIHSKCEFETPSLRVYSNTWRSPINVSTAVQFFESLAANKTQSIRKLHNFANSVVVVDEFHNTMEHYRWEYTLDLLESLKKFNTYFIFASGSSVYYWNIFNKYIDIFETITKSSYTIFQTSEQRRVECVVDEENMNFDSIVKFALFFKKSSEDVKNALVVCNTIKNSVAIAIHFKEAFKNHQVFHLSSHLTPKDRERILGIVKNKLKNNEKLILVATSIIECGIDISFQIGYREKCGLLSYLQFNGRINRGETYKNTKSYMFDFSKDIKNNQQGSILTMNPQLGPSIKVLSSMQKSNITPEYCSAAVSDELKLKTDVIDLSMEDKKRGYRTIAEEFKIIKAHTVTCIIDKEIATKLKEKLPVPYYEISRNSVQLWMNKLDKFQELNDIERVDGEYYIWNGKYDPDFEGIKW